MRIARIFRACSVNICLFFAVTVVLLLISELFTRIFYPQILIVQRPDIYRPVDQLAYEHVPNVHTTINLADTLVDYCTDDNGDRISCEKVSGKGPCEGRLLLIGDSFMDAQEVSNERSTAGLIEKVFSEKKGRNICIENSAVAGYDPVQYAIISKRRVEKTCYDAALIFIFLGNDIDYYHNDFYPPRAPVEAIFKIFQRPFTWNFVCDHWIHPMNQYLKQYSQFAVFIQHAFFNTISRLGITQEHLPWIVFKTNLNHRGWKDTARLLKHSHDEFINRKIPHLFVLIPASFMVDKNILLKHLGFHSIPEDSVDVNQYKTAFLPLLDEMKIPFLDLTDLIIKEDNPDRFYGRINKHFNSSGHAETAKLVTPWLKGIFDEKSHKDVKGKGCLIP